MRPTCGRSVFIFPTSMYGYVNDLTWVKTTEIPNWCERIQPLKPVKKVTPSVGSAVATSSIGWCEE